MCLNRPTVLFGITLSHGAALCTHHCSSRFQPSAVFHCQDWTATAHHHCARFACNSSRERWSVRELDPTEKLILVGALRVGYPCHTSDDRKGKLAVQGCPILVAWVAYTIAPVEVRNHEKSQFWNCVVLLSTYLGTVHKEILRNHSGNCKSGYCDCTRVTEKLVPSISNHQLANDLKHYMKRDVASYPQRARGSRGGAVENIDAIAHLILRASVPPSTSCDGMKIPRDLRCAK